MSGHTGTPARIVPDLALPSVAAGFALLAADLAAAPWLGHAMISFQIQIARGM
jgi:hypothetical protein